MERGKDLNADEAARREVLVSSPVIAIVGRSNDHYYTSYQVGEYLILEGFTVYNVNPMIDEVDGAPSYDSLADVPEKIDIVDVFRKADFVPGIVDEAIAVGAKTVWAQLDVVSDEAREKALAAGLNYADDLCIRTEHERLFKGMVQG
jgi:predicted CoA-binding protein